MKYTAMFIGKFIQLIMLIKLINKYHISKVKTIID